MTQAEAIKLVTTIVEEMVKQKSWATGVTYYDGTINIVSELSPLKLAKAVFNLGLTSKDIEYRLVDYIKDGLTHQRLVLSVRYNEYETIR